MNGTIDLFTLISLIVALVVVLKLRSVLGRRTGDEEARIERLRSEEQRRASAASSQSGKVVALPRRNREETPAEALAEADVSTAEAEARIKSIAGGDSLVIRGLMDILKADPNFDPQHFLTGARAAYEMIVTAFAEGNRKVLRDLLSKDVYEGFAAAIADRESRGERVDQKFVGINKADITEAELDKGLAQITVRFVSQLIKATFDRSGKLMEGDSGKVHEVVDIFTFSRDVSTEAARQNPNWKLIGTESRN
jgi:predicted lipid-binding transport protein (Tim44 family)